MFMGKNFFKAPETAEVTEIPDRFEGREATIGSRIEFLYENNILTLTKKGKVLCSAPVSEYKLLYSDNSYIYVCSDEMPVSLRLVIDKNFAVEFNLLRALLKRNAQNLNISLMKAISYKNTEKTYDNVKEAMKATGFRNPLMIGANKKIEKWLSPHEKVYFATMLNAAIVSDTDVLNVKNWWSIKDKKLVNFVVTNQRVFCLESIFGKETRKEILLDQIVSIDEATGIIFTARMRICGHRDMFIIDSTKDEQSRIRVAIDAARNNKQAAKVIVENAPAPAVTEQKPSPKDIESLYELMQKGIISQEEFESSKKQILAKL